MTGSSSEEAAWQVNDTGIYPVSLAQMGATQLRVTHLINKFKKHDFIDYKNSGGFPIHSVLLSAGTQNPNRFQRRWAQTQTSVGR